MCVNTVLRLGRSFSLRMPAIPIRKSAVLRTIGITGTRPVMM
jgi:hypothetical protein